MSAKNLKLALVISELDIGGAEKNFTNLAVELSRRGHQVQVYSLDPPAEQSAQLAFIEKLQDAKVPIRFLTNDRKESIRSAIKQLRSELKSFHPQLVQAFLLRANLASYWAAPQGVPVSLGIRQAENRLWARLLEKFLISRCKHTVFVSQQVAQHYGVNPPTSGDAKYSIICNGVQVVPNAVLEKAKGVQEKRDFWGESNCLPEASANTNNRAGRFHVFIGRLTEQKNVLQLLDMMQPLLKQYPNDHLVLVGSGPLETQARAPAERSNCRDQIHFVGWQPDPIRWLKHSDTLLLASKWEGLPNVVLEAMSCGLPVLSLPTHGIKDIFFPPAVDKSSDANSSLNEDGQRAYQSQVTKAQAADENAPSEFQALFAEMDRDENRQFLGKWNHQWVSRHFSIAAMTDRYEQLFRQLATK